MSWLAKKVCVGITLGDPSGIGPSIITQALQQLQGLAEFVVIGDKWVFNRIAQSVNRKSQIKFIDLDNVTHKNFKFGKVKAEYGKASIAYLDKALALIKKKQIDCLVTCPISKEAVSLAGLPYRGHTEYLAKHYQAQDLVMMLLNEHLRFTLVTRHIPLKKVSSALNRALLSKTIKITHQSLKRIFLIPNPRIVVCGLNPHASDNGLVGREENQLIKPVIKELRQRIKCLRGPIPADVAISQARHKDYDCVIALYHDQALIPLKLSGPDSGVNITLGRPFVRTSPLHGTAFDISVYPAKANPNSLIAAITLAVRCTLNLKRD